MQKAEFKVKVGDEEVGYYVVLPDGQTRKEAREFKADYFRKNAFKEGVYFTHQIQDLLKKKGLWSDDKEEEIKKVTRDIDDKIKLLQRGKSEKVPTKAALREIVIKEVKPLRTRQLELLSERSQLDGLSLESEAQQLELDYLVVKSTFTDMQDKVYKSLEDYKEKSDEPYTEAAGRELAKLIGFSNPDWFVTLPENALLIKHKFMNSKGLLIDEEGNTISADGKRIDDEGYYINENNERVDSDGARINSDGEQIDFVPFD